MRSLELWTSDRNRPDWRRAERRSTKAMPTAASAPNAPSVSWMRTRLERSAFANARLFARGVAGHARQLRTLDAQRLKIGPERRGVFSLGQEGRAFGDQLSHQIALVRELQADDRGLGPGDMHQIVEISLR